MENNIINLIEEIIKREEYDYYGLRYDDRNYNINDVCNISHQWWQDDPNDGIEEDDSEFCPYNEELHLWDGGELPGTCSVGVNENNIQQALSYMRHYVCCGDNLYLIAGNNAEGGNDSGEIIIENAVVIMNLTKA